MTHSKQKIHARLRGLCCTNSTRYFKMDATNLAFADRFYSKFGMRILINIGEFNVRPV